MKVFGLVALILTHCVAVGMAGAINITVEDNAGGELQIYDRYGAVIKDSGIFSYAAEDLYDYNSDTNGDGVIDGQDVVQIGYIYHYNVTVPDNYIGQLVYFTHGGGGFGNNFFGYSNLVTLYDGMYLSFDATPLDVPPQNGSYPISGDLLLDGSIDINGPLLNLGTNPTDGSPLFELKTFSWSAGPETHLAITNRASLKDSYWSWEVPYQSGQWTRILSLQTSSGVPGGTMNLNGTLYVSDLLIGSQRPLLGTSNSSVQLGLATSATGVYSIAANKQTAALAEGSVAFGYSTTATQKYQFVVGRFNDAQPANTSTVPGDSDQLFVVGNGLNSTAGNRSNAFTVNYGGGATVAKSLAVGAGSSAPVGASVKAAAAIGEGVVARSGQTVLGKFNRDDAGLMIIGNGTGTATESRGNALRVLEDGTVLIPPRGDISMGGFAAGAQP